MKRMILLTALALIVASATFVMAGPWDKTGEMKPGWRVDDSVLSKLDLTAEQQGKIQGLRQSFQKDLEPLRSQLMEKKTEFRLLWSQTKLDPVKIKALGKEINSLEGQLREKAADYQIAFREILTPEQAAKFISAVGDKRHAHHQGGK